MFICDIFHLEQLKQPDMLLLNQTLPYLNHISPLSLHIAEADNQSKIRSNLYRKLIYYNFSHKRLIKFFTRLHAVDRNQILPTSYYKSLARNKLVDTYEHRNQVTFSFAKSIWLNSQHRHDQSMGKSQRHGIFSILFFYKVSHGHSALK